MKRIFIMLFVCLSVSGIAQKRVMVPEDLWKFGRISEVQLSPKQTEVLYGVTTYSLITNKSNRDLFIIDLKNGGAPVQLTNTESSEYNAVFHPKNSRIYYLGYINGEMQIFSMKTNGKDVRQQTSVAGGINGFKISPDGIHIVYTKDVKLDKTPAEVYPDLPKTDVRIFDDLMYRHWDAWHDYAYSHPFVTTIDKSGNISAGIDILEGKQYDTPMNPWGGMEQLSWSPDGTKLAYTCKKFTGVEYSLNTNSDIYIYNITTGETKDITAFNEGYDHDPVFSPKGEYLVWKSMKTPGFEADKERIMLYSFSTKTATCLTDALDQSCKDYKWSAKGDKLYFISGYQAKYHIYCMTEFFNAPAIAPKIEQITKGTCDFVEYAVGDKFLIGAKQSMSQPTEVYKIDLSTGEETMISHANDKLMAELEFGKVEEKWINTVDGKPMLVWVIYPPFFDKTKEYPAILYCEGGPQSAVSQFWSYRWNFQMMAANGYIVMAPNRRGLPTFGQEWNDQISGDYGGMNQLDYLQTVDVLKKEPYSDENRIGAVGASYGGYSVYWLAGHHDHRFKAFIAHCGIYDFYSMYGSTEENFFTNHDYEGPYWQDPEPKSYEFSPHKYVQNWDTPILIITGQNDFRIPYTQSLEAFNCAKMRGIPARLVFFDDETHFVVKPQNAVLWQREFKNWLDKYLK